MSISNKNPTTIKLFLSGDTFFWRTLDHKSSKSIINTVIPSWQLERCLRRRSFEVSIKSGQMEHLKRLASYHAAAVGTEWKI
jgi:hypothetical protein